MPLTFTITENVLPKGQEKTVFKKLCDLMLDCHGILGNTVMTPNVVGSIHVVPEEFSFSGGENADVAFIEWKVPSFVFADRETQTAYIQNATNLVHDATNGTLPKEKIWVNVIHAVDGAWGINGAAMTNDDITGAIAQG